MKKTYSFIERWSSEDVDFLSKIGIIIKENCLDWVKIEDDDIYDCIVRHFESINHPLWTIIRYEYSKEDILSSDYCLLVPMGCGGYPQYKEDDFTQCRGLVYDKDRCCENCFVEHVQVGEFRINKQPKRDLWSFTAWTFDALFVTEKFYREMFEPLGIGYRLVRKRSGKIYEGVLQLDIPIIDEDLDLSMHRETVCPTCGKVKYVQDWSLPCFPLHEHPLPYIYLTKESFGEGWIADRKIIISTELALKLVNLKLIRPSNLIPCRRNYSEFLKNIK